MEEQPPTISLLGVDIGTRNMAFALFRVHDASPIELKRGEQPTLATLPSYTIEEWLHIDLGVSEMDLAVEKLAELFKTSTRVKSMCRAADKIIIERQIGGKGKCGNPVAVCVAMVLRALLLVYTDLPASNIIFKGASIKFTTFRKMGLELPYDAKKATSDYSRRTFTKKNAIYICKEILKQEPSASSWLDLITKMPITKSEHYADSFGLAMAYFVNDVAKVKFPRKRVKK